MTTATSVPLPPKMLTPPPALHTITNGEKLHRIHADSLNGNSFNPCRGRPSRFAPLRIGGKCIPTLYAATSLEAAIYECVFHDVPYDAPIKVIKKQDIDNKCHSIIQTKRSLQLVPLFEPDLNIWGLTRANLVDSPASTYPDTVKWAEMIYSAVPSACGIIWTSRKCDPERALILFKDRISGSDISLMSTDCVQSSPTLSQEIVDAGTRAGITISV